MPDDTPYIEVFRALTPHHAQDRALVLEAVCITSTLVRDGGMYVLLVPQDLASSARTHLGRYAAENVPQPKPAPVRLHDRAIVGAVCYGLLLFTINAASRQALFGHDWFDAGILDGDRFRAGQLWRAITALMLHADFGHLSANIGFGALFGGLAARLYGTGLAWLLILLAAGLAGVLNGLTMPYGRASLGASTAVFAALGAVGVFQWPAGTRGGRLLLPGTSLISALVLLAMLGTGDQHTDIAAHAYGFAAGALLALPMRSRPSLSAELQRWSVGATLALVAAAWLCALLAPG